MQTMQTVSPTRNNFGLIIPQGTIVNPSFVEGSDLIKCVSSTYGTFFTTLDNLIEPAIISRFPIMEDFDNYDDYDPTDHACHCEEANGCEECNPYY